MLKNIFFALGTILCISACGPSQKELDKQQHKEDSLMEIERNSAIEKANQQLLNDTVKVDTLKKEAVKGKNK